MLHEEAAQAGTHGQFFRHLEQQSLEVGCLWMGSLARARGVNGRFGDDSPVKESKEGAEALHEGIMLKHEGHGLLVKDPRVWYHGDKLLAGQFNEHFFLLCLQVVLLSSPLCADTARLSGISSDPPVGD